MTNKKYDYEQLRSDICGCAAQYGLNCSLTCVCDDEVAFREEFGQTADCDRVVIDGASGLLLGLSIMLLCDSGLLSIDSPAERFVAPRELKLPADLTVERLLSRRSGLPDPIREKLFTRMHSQPEFAACDTETQRRAEREKLLKSRGYHIQVHLMGSSQPEVRAGFAPSSLDETLLCEIIARISGDSLCKLQLSCIFEPLGIELRQDVTASDGTPLPDLYSVSREGLERLLIALNRRELFSDETWKTAADIAGGAGSLPFFLRHGTLCGSAGAMEHHAEFILDGNGTAVLIISQEPLRFMRENGVYRRFDIDVIDCLNAAVVYPSHTRMERLSPRNLAGALALSVHPEQSDFVAPPAFAAAQAAASKEQEVFVVSDGGVPVGMLTLSCDPTTAAGRLESLMIDRRFQRRGFGRIAVRWAVDYLRRREMSQILLAVHRDNSAAAALYVDAGFTPAEVHEDAVVMRLDI